MKHRLCAIKTNEKWVMGKKIVTVVDEKQEGFYSIYNARRRKADLEMIDYEVELQDLNA